MKKILISFIACTSVLFTACQDNKNTKQLENDQLEKKPSIEAVKVLEVKSEIVEKKPEKNERIKSQKEIDNPERFNPITGESLPHP